MERFSKNVVPDSTDILVDTGCDMTTLPASFRQYAFGKPLGGKIRIRLAGKGQYLNASEPYRVLLPVLSSDGSALVVEELCCFSECRVGLLGAMHRDVSLRIAHGANEEVGMNMQNGQRVQVKVIRNAARKPVVRVLSSDKVGELSIAGLAGEAQGVRLHSEDIANKGDLLMHHRRFAHAKGARLYNTLKKYNLEGRVTLKDCQDVRCCVCDLLNLKKKKVPRTADPKKEHLKVGEVTLQDLIQLPTGFDGSRYVSVIVDAKSRFLSMMAIRNKAQASRHAAAYVDKMRGLGYKLHKWRTDNGGEFIGDSFETVMDSHGISHSFGAPHTPESQGIVERVNGTAKRLIGKLLRDMKLPVACWPALHPAATQQLNSVVHGSLVRPLMRV